MTLKRGIAPKTVRRRSSAAAGLNKNVALLTRERDEALEQHLACSLDILKKFYPWEYERSRNAKLTDPNGILAGRFPPTVRKPIARLPSGAIILGMADAVVLNDPITGQGSNNAAKAARIYLKRILDNGSEPFDAAWMQQTFDDYWAYAQFATGWTNAMLQPPPPHVINILVAAQSKPKVGKAFVNGFDVKEKLPRPL